MKAVRENLGYDGYIVMDKYEDATVYVAFESNQFKNIDNLSQKIIITNDDIDYSTSAVRHIKLKDFLLMESL